MTTVQIIVLIAFYILSVFPAFYLAMNSIKEHIVAISVLSMIVITIVHILIFTYTLEFNKLKDSNKCPEYEKVENVYKLKE